MENFELHWFDNSWVQLAIFIFVFVATQSVTERILRWAWKMLNGGNDDDWD